MRKLYVLALVVFSFQFAAAQNDVIHDQNDINWLQTFNTIPINTKWSLHAEYQWRRTNGLKHWQQSLLRLGVNYKLNESLSIQTGYGFIQTFPYGDYPVALNGTFPEHRLYEQIAIRHKMKRLTFSHRIRIEQRWLCRKTAGLSGISNNWYFLHRFRYQLRLQHLFWQKNEKQLYGAGADELFIGAGKNTVNGHFDQNRLFLLIGYRINKKIALEAGYINQLLKQGRKVNNRSVLQYNNGFVVSSYINW